MKKIPLTVKMRKGFEDPSGEQAVELARRAEANGFDAVTVNAYGGRDAPFNAVDEEKIRKNIRNLHRVYELYQCLHNSYRNFH